MRPRSVCVGGDFNTGFIQLLRVMPQVHRRYNITDLDDVDSKGLRILFSALRDHEPGDIALTYGITAVQEDSKVGKQHGGVSDAHDLVVARVFDTASTSTAAQPGSDARRSSTRPKQRQDGEMSNDEWSSSSSYTTDGS